MAENNEDRNTEDLSDEASPYRLEEFRRKGQVAQSKELVAIFVALASGMAIFGFAPSIGKDLMDFMRETFTTNLAAKSGDQMEAVAGEKLIQMLKLLAAVGLPITVVGFLLGIGGHLGQIGFLFSTETLTPDFEKINPLQGLKRMFSARNLIETVRVVLKGVVLCFIAYSAIRSEIFKSPELIFRHPTMIFDVLGSAGKTLFFSLTGALAVFAGIDFVLQKREYGKQVRVTRQEAKQEAKEQEGDPLIKSRIRSIQREMARKRMMQAVKKADVIITNPTHIAIALQYDKDKMIAPKVVAKGADFLAERIKKIAGEAGVPMVENVPLARAIFKSVKIGQIIPRHLFQAVAEILAYVYKLKKKKFE
ncbi:MAG: flagellar biosynthesis protein FlhB [Bdellovibrionales bacterium]|nr:flagellar biosynthesis protein FlhB [Bdellovibrionales bacterium]